MGGATESQGEEQEEEEEEEEEQEAIMGGQIKAGSGAGGAHLFFASQLGPGLCQLELQLREGLLVHAANLLPLLQLQPQNLVLFIDGVVSPPQILVLPRERGRPVFRLLQLS